MTKTTPATGHVAFQIPDEVVSTSPEETDRLAASVASTLKPGDVVCLYGDLGAGKTRFVKGVAAFFGIDQNMVSSPTFTLINEYPADIPVYHFDCYRINDVREAIDIGTEDYLYGNGICLIEWAEKIEAIIPDDALHITIAKLSKSERLFRFNPRSE
ncbi:MAG: tRNA (adenosine(37)-N6)-threonylcarbamoyltransferase complex ATPase subunit type 1 TsaE [Rhodothermaceae bacterium]|nr:tRNA (adenosine(37)-N6)-threonylcarbamoyltransferase complex ATPase subunit type 1 TsaE [Rhodothermaceae bacterium]